MKQFVFILFTIVLLQACTNVKKVQVIQDALSTVDSSSLKKVPEIDSLAIVKEIVEHFNTDKIAFTSMNAKIKVDYESEKNADTYIANMSIQKDSTIYITIRGAMGVIGLKALIKRDSVTLFYPLTKKIDKRPLQSLVEIVKIPFSFETIQDLVVGNPIYMDNAKLISFKKSEDKLQASLLGALFKNLVVLDADHTKILQLKLDDININQHRTCNISYSNHVMVDRVAFPLNREIAIEGKSKLIIHMEVKEFGFNEPLKYTFAIPRPGKRR
ncbi:MAG: DUF4292 domain-containing protein [Sediminibacterium sp.]